MEACPSDDDLERLLDGDSGEAVGLHVRECPSCLSNLDRLTDDPSLRRSAETLASRSTDVCKEEELSHLVKRLCIQGMGDWALDGAEEMGDGIASVRSDQPGRLGEFVIEAEVGRGGMGVVYRARDQRVGRLVALKILHPGMAGGRDRLRFLAEARAAARVEHDHVVRLYSTSDPDEPRPYFVMEYIAGPTLSERLRSGPVRPREAAEVVAEVASGLAAAHAAGLVHRDVKPENILFDSANGRAKIGDFGLARIATESAGLTRDGTVAGTPAYLSPEQARGSTEVGPAADVYALGVTLYACLTGAPPFRGTPHRIIQQILEDEPSPPRVLNDGVPRDLETICLKAMEKDPARRYAGAADLAADLRRWLAGEPIRARPIGPIGRLSRVCRRHPRVSALASLAFAATALAVIGITWQWRRAEANLRRADDELARTLDSIDSYFTRVSENRLLDVPSLQPLRRELLAAAVEAYDAIVSDRPGVASVRIERAKARTRLARVVASSGAQADAAKLLDRSLEELETILKHQPENKSARDARFACLTSIGAVNLYATRLDLAGAAYRVLTEECRALRRADPSDPSPIETLYAALHGLGRVATLRGGELTAAIRHYQEAVAVARELSGRRPEYAPYLRNLSRTSALLAEALRAVGREAEAQAVFDEGYAAAKKLVAEHRESLEYRFALAAYEGAVALPLLTQSLSLPPQEARAKLSEARLAFARGLDLDRALARENPEVKDYRMDLLGLLSGASLVEMSDGRLDPCQDLIHEARSIYDSLARLDGQRASAKPTMSALLTLRAYASAQVGRNAEAFAALDEADAILRSRSESERSARGYGDLNEAIVHCARALILRDARRGREALGSWDRACESATPLLRPFAAFLREMQQAEVDSTAPNPKRALKVIPTLDSICSTTPLAGCAEVFYARIYALAAMASEGEPAVSLRARATLRLSKAEQTGYLRDPDRASALDADPLLSRLRPGDKVTRTRNDASQNFDSGSHSPDPKRR